MLHKIWKFEGIDFGFYPDDKNRKHKAKGLLAVTIAWNSCCYAFAFVETKIQPRARIVI